MHSSQTMRKRTRNYQKLGFTPPSRAAKGTLLAQSAVGVAVAATVVIFSYYYVSVSLIQVQPR